MQSLSQICPMEIREALLKSLKMWVDVAFWDKEGIGRCPCVDAVMKELLGRQTVGPCDGNIGTIFFSTVVSSFRK